MNEIKISLAAARVNAKMTQAEVAKQLHLSKDTIRNWEKGKIKPKSIQLNALCDIYNFPVDNIFLPDKST